LAAAVAAAAGKDECAILISVTAQLRSDNVASADRHRAPFATFSLDNEQK